MPLQPYGPQNILHKARTVFQEIRTSLSESIFLQEHFRPVKMKIYLLPMFLRKTRTRIGFFSFRVMIMPLVQK